MSVAEDDIIPITQMTVPVTTGPLTTADSGTILKSMVVPAFYIPLGLRHHDRILYQQSEAAGQRWLTDHTRECSDHRLKDEEYDVDA
ncbi:UNVERIFIED_CONTAM: hypothetical protein K2H54_061677 [Gekko kuhli]